MRSEHVDHIAILCIFVGWFLLSSLSVHLGSLQLGVRFYDIAEVIRDPSRMFFGMQTSWLRLVFAAVCITVLVAAWRSSMHSARLAGLAACGPLILILVCMAALFARTSGDFLTASGDSSRIGGNLLELANGLVRRGGSAVARHIAIGAGGYLAFASSLVLAASAIRRPMRKRH